ncbi:GNAT family N-acetyltransferase [Enteractinococcus helveticum]|uniref:GNAT family N-acetyltransferase n=1 Tax=Enteractinococcus helveticum TaxID=1837282 RepID=UPI000B24E7E5
MGEIYVVCVDPAYQGHGTGERLMDHAHQAIRRAGMSLVMVETGGAPGYAAARTAYEAPVISGGPLYGTLKTLPTQ